jgi:hypothetical protein
MLAVKPQVEGLRADLIIALVDKSASYRILEKEVIYSAAVSLLRPMIPSGSDYFIRGGN